MGKASREESTFAKLDHVGVVVRDMGKAIKYYQSLGIGPFEPITTHVASIELRDKLTDNVKMELRLARMGQIKIELIQPVAGETLHKEFLEHRGEGINHLCFAVDDIDKETAKLVKKGLKVLSSRRFAGGGGNAYFDTDKVGGVLTELLQQPPE